MHTENFIEAIYRELEEHHQNYMKLYADFNNQKLSEILSTIHFNLVKELKNLNSRLPTREDSAYYHAEDSRRLLAVFEVVERLRSNLKNTQYEFYIDEYYTKTMNNCKRFIVQYGGSSIPPNVNKIELYYTIPIFINKTNNKFNKKNGSYYDTKLIGTGSYANVYKYKDEDYAETFVLKKLKKYASEKDLVRFKQEYQLMKNNPHPNIVRVYRYFDNNSYTMDYCGISLKKFIDANNTSLTTEQRLDLISQLLEGIKFLHSKGLYHRDISYNNILIESKFDKLFLKISDFGLTKDENNKMTSTDSSIKGTYIDPCLDKFQNYNAQNDIYALGMMINYIYFGKQNISAGSTKVHKIIAKCVANDLSLRYKTIDEIIKDLFSNGMTEDEFYSKIDIQYLKYKITEELSNYSANDLPSICEGLGLKPGTLDESYNGKAGYVSRRIATLSKADTVSLVLKINDSMGLNIEIF